MIAWSSPQIRCYIVCVMPLSLWALLALTILSHMTTCEYISKKSLRLHPYSHLLNMSHNSDIIHIHCQSFRFNHFTLKVPHPHLDGILQFSGSYVCDITLWLWWRCRERYFLWLIGPLKLCFSFLSWCSTFWLVAWKIVVVDHWGCVIFNSKIWFCEAAPVTCTVGEHEMKYSFLKTNIGKWFFCTHSFLIKNTVS